MASPRVGGCTASQRLRPRLDALALSLALLVSQLAPAGAYAAEPRYRGLTLGAALAELERSGLRLVFSSRIVRPAMRVDIEPQQTTPRLILEELLAPHQLTVINGKGDTLVVVPRARERPDQPPAIIGFVLTRQGSQPLGGVEVRVLEPALAVESAGDGSFTTPVLAAGRYTLEAHLPGFVVERLEAVAVEASGPSAITILMDASPLMHEEVVVTPSQVSLLGEDAVAPLALSRDELLALPHLGGDLFRALTLLPGISSNDVSAQFHVRGGRRDEVQVVLDGQELFEAYHLQDFDRSLSIVGAPLLGRVDLHAGGFPAAYGDRLGGVLDMTTVTPSTSGIRTRLGLSLLSAEVGTGGSVARDRLAFVGLLRRGSIDLASRLLGNEDPSYWDLFGKLDYRPQPRQSLRVNLLHANDRLDVRERGEEVKTIATDYDTSYFWLSHQWALSRDLLVETLASESRVDRHRTGLELEDISQITVVDRRDFDVSGFKQSWSLLPSPAHGLEAGLEVRRFAATYNYASSAEYDTPLALIRSNPGGVLRLTRRFPGVHYGLHVSDRWRVREPLALELGLRWDRHTVTDDRYLSPRASLAYALGEATLLRAAWGHFYQSQRPYELLVEDGETELDRAELAEHQLLGLDHRFGGGGSRSAPMLRVEVYRRVVSHPRRRYENLYEPLNTFPEAEPDRRRFEPSRSVAAGVEVSLRSRASRRLGWWLSYAYSTTEDELDGERVKRSIDQPHALNFNASYLVGRHWQLSLVWRYHRGWPTTPLDVMPVLDEEGELSFEPVLGPLNSERLSDYHRLDLRASRPWLLRHGEVELFIDVQNLYHRRNIAGFDFEIDEETGEVVQTPEHWAGILPSIGVRWQF